MEVKQLYFSLLICSSLSGIPPRNYIPKFVLLFFVLYLLRYWRFGRDVPPIGSWLQFLFDKRRCQRPNTVEWGCPSLDGHLNWIQLNKISVLLRASLFLFVHDVQN